MKKVTIQEIANELGVSRNTVSKALNNTGGLAEATCERILKKAVEMGYKQFSYLKTADDVRNAEQEKGEIALLSGKAFVSDYFIPKMLDRLKKEFLRYGYHHLSTYLVEEENIRQQTLPSAFDPGRVQGVICVELFNRTYDEMLCSLGLPILFVDGPNKRDGIDLPADQLYMDSASPVTRLVNDLLAQGWRRIGFIGDYEACQSLFERYTAFRFSMLMAGAPVEKRFCIQTSALEEIETALAPLSDLPDAFICADDLVATEAIHALRKLGKSVPGDVQICGFNDSPNSRIITPTLTTVHIHTEVMAATAIQLLLSRIDEPGLDCRTVHTQTQLIYRNSTRI